MQLCYLKYKYESSAHVITGDLNIAKDREVIVFLKRGPKYLSAKINWTECRDVIETALQGCCKEKK